MAHMLHGEHFKVSKKRPLNNSKARQTLPAPQTPFSLVGHPDPLDSDGIVSVTF